MSLMMSKQCLAGLGFTVLILPLSGFSRFSPNTRVSKGRPLLRLHTVTGAVFRRTLDGNFGKGRAIPYVGRTCP